MPFPAGLEKVFCVQCMHENYSDFENEVLDVTVLDVSRVLLARGRNCSAFIVSILPGRRSFLAIERPAFANRRQ